MPKPSFLSLLLLYLGFLIPAIFFIPVVLLVLAGMVLWVIAMVRIIRAGSKKWKLLLMLNPFILFFVLASLFASVTYLRGNARFFFNQSDGYVHLYSEKDFDFKYRVFYEDFKGEHYGYFNLFSARRYYMGKASDLTIKLLVNTFGFQHNMYKGYIPGARETWRAVTSAMPDSVFLKDVKPGYTSFFYRDKWHHFKEGSGPYETSVSYNNFFTAVDTLYDGDTTWHKSKELPPTPKLYVCSRFYPLLINILPGTMQDGPCVNIQLLDLVHDRILAAGIVDSMDRRGNYCGEFEGDMIEPEVKSLFRYGCTDPKALNYDSNANCEDHSCVYPRSKKKKMSRRK